MKIAITLLVLIVLGMGAGTILESARGAATASAFVYGALWFRLLLGAFAVNVLSSLIDQYPWKRSQAGYLVTHVSMLVILAGALVTSLFSVEGRLALWEGEESALFVVGDGSPASGGPVGSRGAMGAGANSRGHRASARRTVSLPFSVRLDALEIDYYQGTTRPAMFRSRVTVRDAGGRELPAVIEMNRELSFAGYKLFQSSYTLGRDRDQTVLSVSRDPGTLIVFAGYFLLLVGMTTVIGIRMAQSRARRGADFAAAGEGSDSRSALRAAVWIVAAVGLTGGAGALLTGALGGSAARGAPGGNGRAEQRTAAGPGRTLTGALRRLRVNPLSPS